MNKIIDTKISVVINTYNAEKYLEQTLQSVRHFEEIVVCDMHSTDRTLEIARQHGCRIVFHEKHPIVEPARNFAIQSAKHEWVLLLDADETITEEMRLFLHDFIRKEPSYSAMRIPRRNYFMGRFMHGAYPDRIIRFFRKDSVHWGKHVHAIPHITGEIYNLSAKKKQFAIEHLAHDSVETVIHKQNVYTTNSTMHRNKHYGPVALFIKPLFHFLKTYFLKKSFLDGKAGLIFALLRAQNATFTVMKSIEKRKKETAAKE